MEEKTGMHILGRFNTPREYQPLTSEALVEKVSELVRSVGLTYLDEIHYQFENNGITLCVLLAESHVALHTWYERGYVDADVFVCGVTKDNRPAAEKLWAEIGKIFGSHVAYDHWIAR